MLEINQVFQGRYRIEKIIGKGGMGRVYLAEHIELKNKWAIKEMLFDINGPIDLLAEPNILKQLDHTSLPRIVDIVKKNNTIYIVMDYIDGNSLKQELVERKRFSETEVVDIGKQLAEVFVYLHNHKPKPIIYRDMKPDNVMLTKDGRIKVIDFGIAREFKEESEHDTVLGFTKGYAAPEQQSKDTQSDGRTDIYSLGVTLFHLVTGKSPYEPPYDFTKIRVIDPNISEGLEAIIRKCVQRNPDERYQNAEELLYDLNNIHRLNSTYKSEMKKYLIKKTVSIMTFLVCLGITSLGFKTMASEKQELYTSLIDNGINLIKQHKFDDGISKFKKAQEKIDNRIDSYREIARAYLYEQDYNKCINYIESEVLAKDASFSKDDQLLYIAGTAYFNLNQYSKASEYFQKAIEQNSSIVNYKRDFAVSLGRENKITEAENVLSDIKKDNSDESVTLYVLGEINTVKKNYAEAVSSFEQAINSSKDDEIKIKGYKSIAKLYASNPDIFQDAINREISILEKATSDLKEMNDVELTEMLGSAYYNKAMAVRDNNTSEFKNYMTKSLNCFQNLIDSGYKMPYLYVNIGDIYHYLEDYTNSEKIFNQVIETYPDYIRAYVEKSLLYADIENGKPKEKRDYSKVVETYNQALKYSTDKEKDPQLKPLVNLIGQLRSQGWIK